MAAMAGPLLESVPPPAEAITLLRRARCCARNDQISTIPAFWKSGCRTRSYPRLLRSGPIPAASFSFPKIRQAGYYSYGTPARGAGQYGIPDTIRLIEDVTRQRSGVPFGVGNISLAKGGRFDPIEMGRTSIFARFDPMAPAVRPIGGSRDTTVPPHKP